MAKKNTAGFENLVKISTFTDLYKKKYKCTISVQAIRDKVSSGKLDAICIDGYTFLDKRLLDEKQ